MSPAAAVLLDLALVVVLAIVVLSKQNTRPDRASPTGRSNEVAASTVPTRYMKEPT